MRKKRLKKENRLKNRIIKSVQSYSKGLVAWITFHATVWVYLSYVLAFTGREQIAESLSSEIVRVIIGTAITYSAKALLENIFKYFPWKNKKNNDTENEVYSGEVDDYEN